MLGNAAEGVSIFCGTNTLIGGADPSRGNYIVANGSESSSSGIFDLGTQDTIQSNSIGVGAGGCPSETSGRA